MSKDPSDLGVDLRIAQLCGEGMVGTTWPRIYPHGHSSLTEQLHPMSEKSQKEGHAHQPSLQQLLDDLMQGCSLRRSHWATLHP
jgi:hypothetical protein